MTDRRNRLPKLQGVGKLAADYRAFPAILHGQLAEMWQFDQLGVGDPGVGTWFNCNYPISSFPSKSLSLGHDAILAALGGGYTVLFARGVWVRCFARRVCLLSLRIAPNNG
jgi:hypothetical protein